MPNYYVKDAIKFIKRRCPLIPYFVIRRVLWANHEYMYRCGITNTVTELSDWK